LIVNDLTPIYPPSSRGNAKIENAFLANKPLQDRYLRGVEEARKHPLIRL
jgi:hypothetical protein